MASLVRDKGGEERPLSLFLSPSRPLYSTENKKQSQLSHTPLTHPQGWLTCNLHMQGHLYCAAQVRCKACFTKCYSM